ncbi:MAG: hypothetical protein QME94_14935 [Anaerolineae bacterium]|nr:hypothetical protein [Anaerolineae bacterium]
MKHTFAPMPLGRVKLLPSIFQRRLDLNRRYMMSLSTENPL